MSENSWVLSGIDLETRREAIAEAERRGVSLADYLTDVVLQRALIDQVAKAAPPSRQPDAPEQAPARGDATVARHRLVALEQRLDHCVGVLDGALRMLDSSVSGLAGRLGQVELLAAGAADAGEEWRLETEADMAAVRERLANVERHAATQRAAAEALAGRCADMDQHIAAVDGAVRAAAAAHEALKHAIADDFSAFAHEIGDQLGAGLDEVRTAAERAAQQADAAAAHLTAELRNVRETLDARLQEGASETRKRMNAAFADAAERMNALGDRVTENERQTARYAEHWRAQLADVEDGALTAIEETAETLRQAGAALAAEFARATQDNRAALESVHGDLSAEIGEVRDRLAGALARLKLIDTAAANAGSETATLRETLEARVTRGEAAVRDVLADAQSEWDARFDAVATRIATTERVAAEAHFTLRAETERVETCVFAALEKLARDRTDGDAALQRELTSVREQNASVQARLRQVEAGAAPLGERLARIETALGAQSGETANRIARIESDMANRALDRGFDERLLRLEAAAESEETAHAIAALRGQVGALAAQLDAHEADAYLPQRLDELATRVGANEDLADEATEVTQRLARVIERLTNQTSEIAIQSDARLQKVELGLADMRLDAIRADASGQAAAIAAIEERIAGLEQRQADALETLRAGIAQFLDNNDRRLDALESVSAVVAANDAGAEFGALRQRLEERILEVEHRSVRALQQIADTMAVLEARFINSPEQAARSA